MKKGRLWFKLAVDFWEDPKVISAGESAAILYQKLIGWSKRYGTDGVVPIKVVRRLGGRRWKARMGKLCDVGMCVDGRQATDDCPPSDGRLSDDCPTDVCTVVAFLAWNDSAERVAQRRGIDREKKLKGRAKAPPVPRGHPPKTGTLELESELEDPPNPPKGGDGDGGKSTLRSSLLRGYRQRYEVNTGAAYMTHGRDNAAWDTLAVLCVEQARIEGGDPNAIADRVLDKLFASDGWARENGYPPAHLAKKFGAYAVNAKPASLIPDVDAWNAGL